MLAVQPGQPVPHVSHEVSSHGGRRACAACAGAAVRAAARRSPCRRPDCLSLSPSHAGLPCLAHADTSPTRKASGYARPGEERGRADGGFPPRQRALMVWLFPAAHAPRSLLPALAQPGQHFPRLSGAAVVQAMVRWMASCSSRLRMLGWRCKRLLPRNARLTACSLRPAFPNRAAPITLAHEAWSDSPPASHFGQRQILRAAACFIDHSPCTESLDPLLSVLPLPTRVLAILSSSAHRTILGAHVSSGSTPPVPPHSPHIRCDTAPPSTALTFSPNNVSRPLRCTINAPLFPYALL